MHTFSQILGVIFAFLHIYVKANVNHVLQDVRSQNDTRVAIHNNAGFMGVVAAMHDAPGTWEQCLQGYGVLNAKNSIC